MRNVVAIIFPIMLLLSASCGEATTISALHESEVSPTAAPADVARVVARGKRLVQIHGCLGCHTTDGRDQVGPTWKGLYGSQEKLAGGSSVTVDDGYIRSSIRDPNAAIVNGYLPDIMIQVDLTDAEIDAIVEFIKSLK